jgi:hypothetical protein
MGTPSRRAPEVSSEEGPVRRARASCREVCWAGERSGVLGELVGTVSILVLLVLRWMPRGAPRIWKWCMYQGRSS